MRVLPPASILAGLTGISLLVVKDPQASQWEILYLIATVSMASLGISTGTISHPINIAISKWPIDTLLSASSVPADYARMRRRWDRIMVGRAAFGVVAFVSYLLATIGWA